MLRIQKNISHWLLFNYSSHFILSSYNLLLLTTPRLRLNSCANDILYAMSTSKMEIVVRLKKKNYGGKNQKQNESRTSKRVGKKRNTR